MTETEGKHSLQDLDNLIKKAVKKIEGNKDNDICRYLPSPKGGYIHHFTMRKMKTESPEELETLIDRYITSVEKPASVTPKSRAARGSRKKRDQLALSKHDIDKLLHLARSAGEKDMVRKLTPRKDLRTIKRELIASIRHGRVEPEMWQSYIEAVHALTAPAAQPNHTAQTQAYNPFATNGSQVFHN